MCWYLHARSCLSMLIDDEMGRFIISLFVPTSPWARRRRDIHNLLNLIFVSPMTFWKLSFSPGRRSCQKWTPRNRPHGSKDSTRTRTRTRSETVPPDPNAAGVSSSSVSVADGGESDGGDITRHDEGDGSIVYNFWRPTQTSPRPASAVEAAAGGGLRAEGSGGRCCCIDRGGF